MSNSFNSRLLFLFVIMCLLKVPVPLNRKQSYDCLIIRLLIRLRMQKFEKCFPKCFLFAYSGQRNDPRINIKTIV